MSGPLECRYCGLRKDYAGAFAADCRSELCPERSGRRGHDYREQ